MNIQRHIKQNLDLYNGILSYIEEEDDENNDESFQNLIFLFNNLLINKDKEKLREILLMLSRIIDNHYRSPVFFLKIEKIILYYESSIKQTFTNNELFNIFSQNKRILLFLIQKEIILVDQSLSISISHTYFLKEVEPFQKPYDKPLNYKLLNDEYEKNRQKGENEAYICSLIQNDSVEEFIAYINQKSIKISTAKIKPSIFETNQFLLTNKNITLIEYAAFFGSIQIFRYLLMNNIKLTQSSGFLQFMVKIQK